ncbi:MAG TPA: YbdK family carboxylate-amine ligase [Casimicrobiaceae bacterium]|nr:YbdK family carboxylate-amine ligase [Casimicrobiaceae bacterium]
MPVLDFKRSRALTFGVELELMLVNTRDFNLAPDADDLLRRTEGSTAGGELKPEITQSMVEINTSVHEHYDTLVAELRATRDTLATHARRMNVAIAGGGTHPFQIWSERKIYPTERFRSLSEKYGFLAKQFTVFGQHIHIGCPSADDALYLNHALIRYVPHFIALAASSPFYQGIDTSFDSSRLSVVNAFPLSGTMPLVRDWSEFQAYFDKMHAFGIVQSMKDFYWDVRPKPEYGTVEIRVCDTPLTVDRAAQLAAYAQALAAWIFDTRQLHITADHYLVHSYNRFQACRHGLAGTLVDAADGQPIAIGQDIADTLHRIQPYAQALRSPDALSGLLDLVIREENDAAWLRRVHAETGTLADVVRRQADLWMDKR